jgi:hypothetical protein
MEKMVCVILACCLISSCGGGGSQELPLAEAPEVPVETLQKADKPEVFLSKTGKIVLAISVLANLALAWKLWAGKKQEVKNEMPKIDIDSPKVIEPAEMPKREVTNLPMLDMQIGSAVVEIRRVIDIDSAIQIERIEDRIRRDMKQPVF